jgi:hypothetical protein
MGRSYAWLLLLPALACASITFEQRWHWFIADVGRSAAQLSDGGYVVSGGTQVTTNSFGVVLARTDSLGDTVSVHHILNADQDGGFSCRLSDGGYAVLAESGGRIFVRKFNQAGDSVWDYRSTWGGPISAIIPTFDGGCLVAGRIPDTSLDMGAIKLAADGHEEWARWYDEPRMFDSWAHGAAQTRDSGYILCGEANNYSSTNMRLARLSPNGDSAWTRLYSGPVGPMLNAVVETPDNGFLAAGYEFDTLSSLDALYLLRTDSAGNLLWTHDIAVPGAATQAAALRPTSDGGYVVVGQIDWTDSARVWLLKTDANADTVWTRILGGPGKETGADVEQTTDGGYVVVGTSDSAGGSVLIIKTDSLGLVGVEESRPAPVTDPVLTVIPNPGHNRISVRYSPLLPRLASLRLYDMTGRMCRSWQATGPSGCELDVTGLAPGVYLLRLKSDDINATRKLVIR